MASVTAELQRRHDRTKFFRFKPYPKQLKFYANGSWSDERLFKAANQVGKTFGGGFEWAAHLTGRYPEWWPGRRWNRPVRFWAASEKFDATRDGIQRILLGEPQNRAAWGTGLIPGADIYDWSLRHGVPNAVMGLVVKHHTNGVFDGFSTLGLKSYVEGRTAFQVETLDGVWFDEEPPMDIYSEGLTRTNATEGMVMLTFTPNEGMSEVVYAFKDCDGF